MAATNSKAKQKRPAEDWRSPGSPHELDAVDQVAHTIVQERPDLLPSVERIMEAPLAGDGRLRALTLFQESLHTPGDPNRDPRVAIARCLDDGEPS